MRSGLGLLLFHPGEGKERAIASDPEDGDLTPAITWSSNLSGVLGSGSPLTVTLPLGAHHIRAEVTDCVGQPAASEASVLVAEPL